jgi:hypothetical protein
VQIFWQKNADNQALWQAKEYFNIAIFAIYEVPFSAFTHIFALFRIKVPFFLQKFSELVSLMAFFFGCRAFCVYVGVFVCLRVRKSLKTPFIGFCI